MWGLPTINKITLMKGESMLKIDDDKPFAEVLKEAQKKQNEELKNFIRELDIGDPEDINWMEDDHE